MEQYANTYQNSERSVRNRQWIVRELPNVQCPNNIPKEAAAIAYARGNVDLEAFFTPSFKKSMPNPAEMMGMEEAAARVARSIITNESIAIIGDYDVDGATSTAFMIRLLKGLGHTGKVNWVIPDRMVDGYGPNERLIEEMNNKDKIDLLILLDSGTTSFAPVELARNLGIDVVILDHHEPGDKIPNAILVNPKQPGEDRNLEYLCTAGICFLFAVALQSILRKSGVTSEFDIRTLLGLTTLGTIADVVPLTKLNRTYVQLGLSRLPAIPGIVALAEAAEDTSFTVSSCGFVLAPCINAAGRIDEMQKSVILLTTDDTSLAREIAQELVEINKERRKIQKQVFDEALDQVKMLGDEPQNGYVLFNNNWHPGVVGIVAGKVRELFDKPTVIIGEAGKGSARTIEGFDIGGAIIEAANKGLLIKGGGHKAAAGLTIDPEKVDQFREFMMKNLDGFDHQAFYADLVIECGKLKPEIATIFDLIAPFGQANPKPRVILTGGVTRKVNIMKNAHVKLLIQGEHGYSEALMFNGFDTPVGKEMVESVGKKIDLYGTVEVNQWMGNITAFIKPEDAIIIK